MASVKHRGKSSSLHDNAAKLDAVDVTYCAYIISFPLKPKFTWNKKVRCYSILAKGWI